MFLESLFCQGMHQRDNIKLVLVINYRDQILNGKEDICNRNAICVKILAIIMGRKEKYLHYSLFDFSQSGFNPIILAEPYLRVTHNLLNQIQQLSYSSFSIAPGQGTADHPSFPKCSPLTSDILNVPLFPTVPSPPALPPRSQPWVVIVSVHLISVGHLPVLTSLSDYKGTGLLDGEPRVTPGPGLTAQSLPLVPLPVGLQVAAICLHLSLSSPLFLLDPPTSRPTWGQGAVIPPSLLS